MARTVTIKLGDEDAELRQRKTRESSAWRKSLEAPAREIIGRFTRIIDWQSVDLADGDGVSALASAAIPLLTDSLDTIRELVAGYAPELKDRLDDAYDDEVVATFVEVLRLAFPLAGLAGTVGLLRSPGSTMPATPPSSPSANGVSGTTISTTAPSQP
jgi:hypothetical protein